MPGEMRRGGRPVRFPLPDRPRLWGVALSHYQVEGDDPCDWTDWEKALKTRGEPCGDAVSSWEQYESDALLAKAAGANAFRFSISWSRVEPRSGAYSDDVLGRYRRLIEHLVAIDLEPVVTLFHYTHPSWFHATTPWTSSASVERFARYTRKVVEALGNSVRMYVPLNEPLVFLLAGYLDGQIPPGIRDPVLFRTAFNNMLTAHAAAASVVRELNPDAAVGVAHNMMAFAPDRWWNPLDRLLARAAHRCYNESILEAFATGRWSFVLPPLLRIKGRSDDLPGSLDFFGVNYYSRLHFRSPGRERGIGDFHYRDRSGHGLTDNGWEVIPEMLTPLLIGASQAGFPLVVTENGIADGTDAMRGPFLTAHAREIEIVESRGVPIHGYFHWSLLDNYEWLDGYGPRFGLYEVDRSTMRRAARDSVAIFRDLGRQFLARGTTR